MSLWLFHYPGFQTVIFFKSHSHIASVDWYGTQELLLNMIGERFFESNLFLGKPQFLIMLPSYNMGLSDSTSAPLMQNQESMSSQGYAAQPVPVAQPVQSVPVQPVNPVQSAPIPAQPVGMAPPVNPNPLEYLMQCM